MNKREKEVQETALKDEKKVIRQLKQVYEQASKDCSDAIAALNARSDLQNIQSIIYQKQYQQAVKNQIDGILNTLHTSEFDSIASYLTTSYENGYVGAMYDLQGQGIPVISPINQTQVANAVEIDSKISTTMYEKLGEDVSHLKKSIKAEVSRGIANGSTWLEVAEHIAKGMNSPFNKAINNSIRIARTEGHRVQQTAQLDALNEAKDVGADVVKQWDATLDDRTRPEHQQLDGQIKEIDEEFEAGGYKAMMPGGFGNPAMDCNCRCCLLQRARWALDEDELQTLKDRAAYFGLDKTKDFEEYKKKYLQAADENDTIELLQEGKTYTAAVKNEEDKIYADSIETAVVLDGKGNVLFRESNGATNYVMFSTEQTAMMKGATLTHNHPSNSTFSPADLNTLVKGDLKTIRATGKEKTYQLSKNGKTINGSFASDFKTAMAENERITDKEYIKLERQQKNGELSYTEFQQALTDLDKKLNELNSKWLKENAKDYGFRYSVIERK